MKKVIRTCLSLGILLLTVDLSASVSKPTPPPEDTTIRILLVADNRVPVQTINQAKSYLLAALQSSLEHRFLPATQTANSVNFATMLKSRRYHTSSR